MKHMAKKKHPQISVSQEDNAQAQRILEHYHEITNNLHTSTEQKQAEAALTEINDMPEAAQMALVKALSNERHADAADLLSAIHELSPIKNVRKEARRSLIRLEGARIYPQWNVPIERIPLVQIEDTTNPPRFWKGLVTDSLGSGEVQLLLCWEQGDGYRDVRVLSFLLEFWHDGVKDFFTRIESKRSIDNLIDQMSQQLYDLKLKDCSLAEGRRLLLDALETNKKSGTVPHKDYRYNLSLVNRLILEAPGIEEEEVDVDEESEDHPDLSGLDPMSVVVNFVEAWADGDFDLAYELLSSDSSIREGLSKDEWIEHRDAWVDEADPVDLEPTFVREREPQKSRLWLPFGAGQSSNRKEVEAGWSIEMDETPLSDTLPELPKASTVFEETGRHWFWASYTLVQDQDEWRIQSITDEATNSQNLPIAELQKRVQELDSYLEEFTKKHKPADLQQFTDEEAQRHLEEVALRAMQAVYYTDALIKKMPLDRTLYEEATGRTLLFGQLERCAVYLEQLAHRFAEKRDLSLRELAEVYRRLSNKYFEIEDDERAERFQELAEEALKESLAIEDSMEAHISLAELLIAREERFDEARDHLLQAKPFATDPSDEAHIEMHLGEVDREQEQYQESLRHYQRVAELVPDEAESWFDIAEAHQVLKNFEEAETNYKRAIELAPDSVDYYYALSKLYSEHDQPDKALEVLEDGLDANPDSAVLNVYLAWQYYENGDYRQAEIFLEKAERLDPELQAAKILRQLLNLSKARLAPASNITKLGRSKKKRRR